MLDNRSTGNSEPSDPATAASAQAAREATAASPSAADAAIAALADRVATARGKLPLQTDPALFAELSEAEIAAERDLAEWMRKQRRQQRRRAVSAELAAEKRDRRVALSVRRADDADTRWHRRALAARRRVSNPDARLAQLYRRAEWSSRALIGVVVLGMLWAGVNVQHNLVPSGNMSDPLYWLSYGFEAMISIPIITIMVVATTAARWGREIARGKVVFLETALLGVTIALNAGPHLAAGELARAAESGVAPVMVGVVIWLHAWVSARYAQLIDAIPVENDTTSGQPPHLIHTTVEFGEPRARTFPEFTPETADSVALPIGHTARPADDSDPFAGRFDLATGLFGTPTTNAEYAQPNTASPTAATQRTTAPDPHTAAAVPNDVAAPSATPQQPQVPAEPPLPHGHNETTGDHQNPRYAATAEQAPATAATGNPRSAPAEFPTHHGIPESHTPPTHTAAEAPAAHRLSHTVITDSTTIAPAAASEHTPTPHHSSANPNHTGSADNAPGPHTVTADRAPAGPTDRAADPDAHSAIAHPIATPDRTGVGGDDAPSKPHAAITDRIPAESASLPPDNHIAVTDDQAVGPNPHNTIAEPASHPGQTPPTVSDLESAESTGQFTRGEPGPTHLNELPHREEAPIEGSPRTNTPAQHPAQRAAAMSDSGGSSRKAARTERGTQLALDEQTATETRVPQRPRIVPDPETETRPRGYTAVRDIPEPHDPWDDGDETDPDSDETGVWAVAREISARRLSKLPVDQLAEVLTLADESWTPAAIGASIGLPGSRILGILEAARRLARPYAVSS